MDLSRWRGRRGHPTLRSLQEDYWRASEAGDVDAEIAVLDRIIELYPQTSWAWFDRGLRAKWAGDWRRAAELNERALQLEDVAAENPSAWNLGIAATALGDWRTARRAWTAYGIALPPGPDDEPISGDFGLAPVRLNPEPRHPGQTELLIDGRTHDTEVVWCQRLCPARAVIRNVPLPTSGHRFGDVVLHDGEPVGERQLGESKRAVFNELARVTASAIPTLEVEVVAPQPGDLETLLESFVERDFGAEDWTSSVRMLCRECSEGSPDDGHKHDEDAAPSTERRLGVAAPLDVADELVDAWVIASPARDRGPLTVVA